MKKNIFAGLVISALFLYLAVRGIDVSEFIETFKFAKYNYFFLVVAVMLLVHYLRSYRWGVIIESLVKYRQGPLLAISSVGFMAIGVLPARLGEFVRPYLVKQKSGVRMSSTMATIVVERVFDMLTIMVVLFVVVLRISLPPIIFKTGIITLSISFSVLAVLIFLAVKKEFSLEKIDRILTMAPSRLQKPLFRMAHSFIEGLQILPDIKKTLYVIVLSIVIWLSIGLSAYVLFFSFGFNLSLIKACALTVIIALGVMLPAAPGFVGTYHYACVLGLTFFGVSKPEALSYAVALHFLQFIPIVVLGLLFLPFQKISLPAFFAKDKEELESS